MSSVSFKVEEAALVPRRMARSDSLIQQLSRCPPALNHAWRPRFLVFPILKLESFGPSIVNEPTHPLYKRNIRTANKAQAILPTQSPSKLVLVFKVAVRYNLNYFSSCTYGRARRSSPKKRKFCGSRVEVGARSRKDAILRVPLAG